MFSGFWGLDDARRHRDRLFVFGDNDARRGLAGQAVIRGEPNAIGLATKRSPSHVAHAYYRCGSMSQVDPLLLKILAIASWHLLERAGSN